jgi:two-component system chemotaxis sensor kinase CheA
MFIKSKLFLKAMFIVASIIVIYTLAITMLAIPKIDSSIEVLEEKNAKEVLAKVVMLTKNFHANLETYKQDALQRHKDELKKLADSTLSIMQAKYEQSQPEAIKENLEKDAQKLQSLLINFYNTHKDTMSQKELQAAFIHHIELSSADMQTRFFWISDEESQILTYPDVPKLKGKDIQKYQDADGNYIFKDVLALSKTAGKGFTSYPQFNPKTKKIEDTLSYLFVFKPFGWVISIGEYQQALENKIRNKLYTLVKQLRYGNNDYFFITDYNNVTIAHPFVPDGMDFSNVKDKRGNLIVPPMVKIALKEGEGYTSYWWKKNKKDSEIYEKLSFSKIFPQWELMIGTGVYIDDIEKEVAKRKESLMLKLRSLVRHTRIGKEGYLFIFNGSGKMLMHPNNNIIGKNLKTMKNPGRETFIFDDLVQAAKKPSKELIYQWDKPSDANHYIYNKVAWLEYIPELDWYVATSVYTDEVKAYSDEVKKFILFLAAVVIFFSMIYSLILLKKFLAPILNLSRLASKVTAGDYSVRCSLDQNDELGALAKDFNHMIGTINDHIKNLDSKVNEKTAQVTNLLDNADQGFLSFGKDFIIDKSSSKECVRIFRQEVSGKKIEELLFKEDQKKIGFFQDAVKSIFEEESALARDTMLSLLQKEYLIENKIIEVEYKLIADNTKIMLIATDVTEKRKLERKVEIEKKVLQMVVSVVSSIREFFEIIESYEEFFHKDNISKAIDTDQEVKENLAQLYRTVHTFKGLCVQKELIHTVKALHEFEEQLAMLKHDEALDNAYLITILQEFEAMKFLEKDLKILQKVLGEDFFDKKGSISVKEKVLVDISNKFEELIQNDTGKEFIELYKAIKNLHLKPIKELFQSYPKMIEEIAKRLDKNVQKVEIICDEGIKVNDTFSPFIKSLIHVFRNSVDHGIENSEERILHDKNPLGRIECHISQNNENLEVEICDDGRGIDIEQIKAKAVSKGLCTQEECEGMDESVLIELIFNDDFSTKDEVSEISGRGVGLSSVKVECEKLGGTIEIKNHLSKGVTFKFTIPHMMAEE